MNTLWDDNLNKYVNVPEYKIRITLDIPDEGVSDDNISDKTYHNVRMRKVTLCYLTKEIMDMAYESFIGQFCKGDGVRLVQAQDKAIMLNHIVMIEKVVE